MSSLNTVVTLAASRSLPPNDSSYTVEITSGPQVRAPNGDLRSLGTVTPVNGKSPAVTWNLNPANPPPGTLTCTTLAPCDVQDRSDIVYTIEDEWGNASEGVLSPTLVPTVFPQANVVFYGVDGQWIGRAHLRPRRRNAALPSSSAEHPAQRNRPQNERTAGRL